MGVDRDKQVVIVSFRRKKLLSEIIGLVEDYKGGVYC